MIEWDEDKDRINRAKHRIGLAAAEALFEGPFTEDLDIRESYGEDRMLALASSAGGSSPASTLGAWR